MPLLEEADCKAEEALKEETVPLRVKTAKLVVEEMMVPLVVGVMETMVGVLLRRAEAARVAPRVVMEPIPMEKMRVGKGIQMILALRVEGMDLVILESVVMEVDRGGEGPVPYLDRQT
eukprot:gene2811-3608_t